LGIVNSFAAVTLVSVERRGFTKYLREKGEALLHEDIWVSGSVGPLSLDLGTSWRLVASFTPRPFYPEEITLGSHWIGGWVGPRTCLDDLEKILDRTGTRTPAIRPVASRYTDYAILVPDSLEFVRKMYVFSTGVHLAT
jgi:hypothetical protein